MEKAAFDLLAGMERSWWYRGRTRALAAVLSRSGTRPVRILDFGAGFGGMYEALAARGTEVYAYEPDPVARAACTRRGYVKVYATEAEALAERYDLISLLDVLEHIEDDTGFLRRAQGALTEEGSLLISVPAFQFLWSAHDIEHQHFRRYTVRMLRDRLRAEGYAPAVLTYWNTLLFLPAALMRLLGRTGESSLAPGPVGSLLYSVVWLESLALRYLSLPFGTGIVGVARRKRVSAIV